MSDEIDSPNISLNCKAELDQSELTFFNPTRLIRSQNARILAHKNRMQELARSPALALKFLALELLSDGNAEKGIVYASAALNIDPNIFRNSGYFEIRFSYLNNTYPVNSILCPELLMSTNPEDTVGKLSWAHYLKSCAIECLNKNKFLLNYKEDNGLMDKNVPKNG